MTDLELLEKRIKASAFFELAMLLGVLVLAVIAGAGAVMLARTAGLAQAAFSGLACLVMLLASYAMSGAVRDLLKGRDSRVFQQFSGDARLIAWVHQTRGAANGLKVYFRDGLLVTLHCNTRDAERLFAFARQRAPQALFGYNPDYLPQWGRLVKEYKAQQKPPT